MRHRFTVRCPRCNDNLVLSGRSVDDRADEQRTYLIGRWMGFHEMMCGTVETAPSLKDTLLSAAYPAKIAVPENYVDPPTAPYVPKDYDG